MQLPLMDLPSNWEATPVSDLPSWEGAPRLGIDIETFDPNLLTTGPSVRTGGFIAGVSFAIEDGPAHYMPTRHQMGGNLPENEVFGYLRDQAKNYEGIIVGANLNYDLDYLAQVGIFFPKATQRDVQVAEPLIDELQFSYSLDAIAKRHGFPGKAEAHLRSAASHYGLNPKADLWKLPARHVGLYATEDAVLPLRVLRRQERIIDDQDLWQIFELECQLQPVLLRMKRWGVRVDLDKLDAVAKWSLEQEELQLQEIHKRTGHQLKVGDITKKPPLLSVLRSIGIELTEETESGDIKLTAEILGALDHPVANCINRARKVNKLRTTFVASIHNHLVGDRIHCTFNQLRTTREQGDEKGAKFGRISCSDPNLQQQPSRDDFAAFWRSIYIPDNPGQLFMSADYSQQEPRLTTHFAEIMRLPKAREMAEKFRTDPDTDNHDMMTVLIHPETAKYHRKDPEFLKVRKPTKEIFLGLSYGMGGGKMAVKLGLPTVPMETKAGFKYIGAGPEAQRLLDTFNRRVPYVKQLAKLCEQRAKARGYILTILGRRCRFPRTSNGEFDWTYKGMNRLIQGSGGDQTKLAMVMLDAEGLMPQLQVHDEVCRGIDDMKQAYQTKEIMEHCLELNVPSRVDLEIGPSWGEGKEIA